MPKRPPTGTDWNGILPKAGVVPDRAHAGVICLREEAAVSLVRLASDVGSILRRRPAEALSGERPRVWGRFEAGRVGEGRVLLREDSWLRNQRLSSFWKRGLTVY